VGLWPLKLVQENRPNLKGAFNSTDMGQRRSQEIGVGTNAVAYVTGQPAPPQLKARFEGAPDHVHVTWGMNIVTERPERGTTDNRNNIPGVTLFGDGPWDITAAMNNEIVGGKCTLTYKIEYAHGNASSQTSNFFYIRGKNPKDADVRNYINTMLLAGTKDSARYIALHETKQKDGYEGGKTVWRIYNQFNAGNYTHRQTKAFTPAGSLNMSNDTKGWGIGQISTTSFHDSIVSTKAAWDWHENMRIKGVLLNDKLKFHTGFMNNYKNKYGPLIEPPAQYTTNSITMTSQEWAVLVLYNGGGGIPPDEFGKQSPWQFKAGTWRLYDNGSNYMHKVMADVNLVRTNGVIIKAGD